MSWAVNLWNSTVGKKAVMALTGLVGFGFVIVHMLGNMLVYAGPAALDAYGAALKANPAVLWGARTVLVGSVCLHIFAAMQLQGIKNAARPMAYQKPGNIQAKPTSKNMIVTGVILSAFIIYHILHFTVGAVHPTFVHGKVYANLVAGFSNPLNAGFYIVCMAMLGGHLAHGAFSLFYSLGLVHPKYIHAVRTVTYVAMAAVVLGNISIPLSVLVGILKPA